MKYFCAFFLLLTLVGCEFAPHTKGTLKDIFYTPNANQGFIEETDIPLYPGLKKTADKGLIYYHRNASPETMSRFYDEALSSLGWEKKYGVFHREDEMLKLVFERHRTTYYVTFVRG